MMLEALQFDELTVAARDAIRVLAAECEEEREAAKAVAALGVAEESSASRTHDAAERSEASAQTSQLLQFLGSLTPPRIASSTREQPSLPPQAEAIRAAADLLQLPQGSAGGAAAARRAAARERRENAAARAQEALSAAQNRLFASRQEARRFFEALRFVIPPLEPKPSLWRCNAYGSVHRDPSGCADPSKGGEWLHLSDTDGVEIVID